MTKDEEIEVIRSGQIHYKDIDIQETSVRLIGTTTAILLNKIRLVASAAMRSPIRSWSPKSRSMKAAPGR